MTLAQLSELFEFINTTTNPEHKAWGMEIFEENTEEVDGFIILKEL